MVAARARAVLPSTQAPGVRAQRAGGSPGPAPCSPGVWSRRTGGRAIAEARRRSARAARARPRLHGGVHAAWRGHPDRRRPRRRRRDRARGRRQRPAGTKLRDPDLAAAARLRRAPQHRPHRPRAEGSHRRRVRRRDGSRVRRRSASRHTRDRPCLQLGRRRTRAHPPSRRALVPGHPLHDRRLAGGPGSRRGCPADARSRPGADRACRVGNARRHGHLGRPCPARHGLPSQPRPRRRARCASGGAAHRARDRRRADPRSDCRRVRLPRVSPTSRPTRSIASGSRGWPTRTAWRSPSRRR